MPAYTADALVLRRSNIGESDRVVTLFTHEMGKISAVAKGARRTGSRFSGATELFTHSRLLLATGKTLDIVTQSEIRESFPQLRMDLNKLARATYICELLDKLTMDRDASSSEELFQVTNSALKFLEQVDNYQDGVLHAYELRLLAIQGYAPILDKCARCGGHQSSKTVGFSSSSGGVLCASHRNEAQDAVSLSQDAIGMMQQLENAELSILMGLNPTKGIASQIAKTMRWYIRSRIDYNLKSADFLDMIRANK